MDDYSKEFYRLNPRLRPKRRAPCAKLKATAFISLLVVAIVLNVLVADPVLAIVSACFLTLFLEPR